MRIELTDADLAVCRMFATLRTINNRMGGVKRQIFKDYKDCLDHEEEGVMGEYAFCKKYNLFFDGTFSGKDAGYDCVLKGKKIDIKTTSLQDGNLIAFQSSEKSDVDIFILTVVDRNSVEIVGWIEKENFINPENLVDHKYGKRYFLPREKLKKMKNGD